MQASKRILGIFQHRAVSTTTQVTVVLTAKVLACHAGQFRLLVLSFRGIILASARQHSYPEVRGTGADRIWSLLWHAVADPGRAKNYMTEAIVPSLTR